MSNTDINHLITFIENNITNLLQIYINERLNNGDGLLLIKGDKNNNKVDVGYIKECLIDDVIKEQINKLNYTNSKAYFFVYDVINPKINSLIEKELDLNMV